MLTGFVISAAFQCSTGTLRLHRDDSGRVRFPGERYHRCHRYARGRVVERRAARRESARARQAHIPEQLCAPILKSPFFRLDPRRIIGINIQYDAAVQGRLLMSLRCATYLCMLSFSLITFAFFTRMCCASGECLDVTDRLVSCCRRNGLFSIFY
jgi:hypothetical protein